MPGVATKLACGHHRPFTLLISLKWMQRHGRAARLTHIVALNSIRFVKDVDPCH